MLFQMELLNRQCPVPEKERHPAFHGMLLAEGLLGLRVESSEKELSQSSANAAPKSFCPQLQQLKGPQLLQMGGHSTGWPAPRFGSAGRTAGPSHHS